MKVLELCLSPDLGGLELYMFRCAQKLSQTDEVLAVVVQGGRLEKSLNEAGLASYTLSTKFRALPLLAARKLAALIDRERVDVVHMHWGKDLALAAFAKALSRRKPKLVYTRQMQITRPKRDAYHRFLYRQTDAMIAITRVLAEDMRRFIPEAAARIDYLYYGVDAPQQISADERIARRAELGVPPEAFLIGLFGRIKHYKGQHLFIDALRTLRPKGLPIYGLVVGRAMEEAYLADLKAQCVAEGLPVIFMDFVQGPQALMQSCDAVVLTTVEETFGLVLVEAMRAGVAVVGSDRGGVPEIIEHDESGLLFRSGDAEGLAEQLYRLCTDAPLLARLAASGKAKADRVFSDDVHFPELRRRLVQLARIEPHRSMGATYQSGGPRG